MMTSAPPPCASDVSGVSPQSVHYWKPMCVALTKYDAAYALSQDYAATTTCPSDVTTAVDDHRFASTTVPPPAPPPFSTLDRRDCLRQASRAANLPAAAAGRRSRPHALTASTHARCDEHLYEPATAHDAVPSSRDHRTFADFAD